MFDSHLYRLERYSRPYERHPRLFKKGEMKYVILDLLKEKPSHGYELSLALAERFHGLYSPSSGGVYPILQLLEDMEYVTSSVLEGKKIYTITAAGNKFLKGHKKTLDNINERLHDWWDSENQEYIQDVRTVMGYVHEINDLVRYNTLHKKDPDQIIKIKKILDKTFSDIQKVYEEK